MISTRLHPDKQSAAQAIAREIADLIQIRSKSGKPTVLGLATGSTPLPLYAELVRLHREEGLSFRSVITFNLDEYEGLGPNHPQSYRYFMEDRLFRHLDIPAANIHIPDGTAQDPARECADYEASIRAAGGIDLQILGIGRTGHIGFNEPPSAADSRTRRVHLDAVTRQDNSVFFGELSLVPPGALTMGVATILDARRVALLAFGDAKAEIVARAMKEAPSAGCPATWLQRHPACTFHLDAAAASRL
ncbi:MAG: glucosamine-6-phosphate deaminase [Verrucomicrobia bacterium]|nr:glucosamine-6-phosphate deaminase [Verrucomicrobiota bacterium]